IHVTRELEDFKYLKQDNYSVACRQGRPSPSETMMHFPPCFRFPPIFENFSNSYKNVPNFTFSRKNSSFSSAEISDHLFFSHRPQISNFPPISPVSVHFPLFQENYYFPPTLTNSPPVLHKFTCFLHTIRVFLFPLLLP